MPNDTSDFLTRVTKQPENVSHADLSNTDVIQDSIAYGFGLMRGGKRIDPKDVYLSPEAQLLAEAAEALEFYADVDNYWRSTPDGDFKTNADSGQRARDFLAKLGR